MAAQLGFLSMTQQSQHHQNPSLTTPNLWMWNPKQLQDDDDSWEVRAFAEDTASINGTTWPPRSYTCTFCRREFQSAQALGGHMNVHRRDRAKLHQRSNSFNHLSNSSPSPNSSSLLIPSHQEFASNGGGLCLLYQLPNPNGVVFAQTAMNNACTTSTMSSSPSTLLSMSPHPPNNQISPSMNDLTSVSPPEKMNFSARSYHRSSKVETSISISKKNWEKTEELDLELRLGHR
ncbi:hypothetical protein HS088_TW20G00064 [Tripterygium wilfordii]|uniref:C2H2-type domain-containing protein n=1 Tax=Tripterygium wilfordii TaxID=458696 RepID=A0A7J7C6D7_TRIWF|nr:transcriptional regulator SUPERMAN-like [Tripterygium wilfordii]KAF5729700.1 hypothetical protein HS088_TW20G00064 [Tripterygium wilfordii]